MTDTEHRHEARRASRCGRNGLRLAAAAGSLLLCLGGPLAASAQSRGESWSAEHMQSNAANRLAPSPPRPPILGSNRFEQSASSPTAAPPTSVPETTLQISPHGWAPGGAADTSRSSASNRASSSGGISGGPLPSVSSGIQRQSSGRSSSLRSPSSRIKRSKRR